MIFNLGTRLINKLHKNCDNKSYFNTKNIETKKEKAANRSPEEMF